MGTETRVVFIGDDLVAGREDPRAQGWPGRVVARTEPPGSVTSYVLAVPGETTTALATRWEAEALKRFNPSGPNRLVVGLGWSDFDAGVSVARARLNLANILDKAASLRVPTMVVGPPPRKPEENSQLAAFSAAYAEVAGRRETPYVETLAPLTDHEQWLEDMHASAFTWPAQQGYGLIAWLVLHSNWESFIK